MLTMIKALLRLMDNRSVLISGFTVAGLGVCSMLDVCSNDHDKCVKYSCNFTTCGGIQSNVEY